MTTMSNATATETPHGLTRLSALDVSAVAAADLSGHQFCAVYLDTDSFAALPCGPDEFPFGILQNCPAEGEEAIIRTAGQSIVRISGEVRNFDDLCIANDTGELRRFEGGGVRPTVPMIANTLEFFCPPGAQLAVAELNIQDAMNPFRPQDMNFVAAEDLSNAQGCAVTFRGDILSLGVCPDSDIPLGVLVNAPQEGEQAIMRIRGRCLARMNGPVAKGDSVGIVNDRGELGDRYAYAVGNALQDVAGDGGSALVPVLLRMKLQFQDRN